MDELEKALRTAAAELCAKYNWQIDETGGPLREFLEVVGRHIEPLIDLDAWRKRQIAALRAEIAEHEAQLASMRQEGA